jgi:hypothetical protein
MAGTVNCHVHGAQPETFVCQHVVQTLRDGVPRGLFWANEPNEPRPDAWCADCNSRVAASGGDWTPEAEALARVALLCGACYDRAKAINLGAQANPYSSRRRTFPNLTTTRT